MQDWAPDRPGNTAPPIVLPNSINGQNPYSCLLRSKNPHILIFLLNSSTSFASLYPISQQNLSDTPWRYVQKMTTYICQNDHQIQATITSVLLQKPLKLISLKPVSGRHKLRSHLQALNPTMSFQFTRGKSWSPYRDLEGDPTEQLWLHLLLLSWGFSWF